MCLALLPYVLRGQFTDHVQLVEVCSKNTLSMIGRTYAPCIPFCMSQGGSSQTTCSVSRCAITHKRLLAIVWHLTRVRPTL